MSPDLPDRSVTDRSAPASPPLSRGVERGIVRLPPPPDDDPRFTVEEVCFIPSPRDSRRGAGMGRLATCIAEGGCTIGWHEHLFRMVPVPTPKELE